MASPSPPTIRRTTAGRPVYWSSSPRRGTFRTLHLPCTATHARLLVGQVSPRGPFSSTRLKAESEAVGRERGMPNGWAMTGKLGRARARIDKKRSEISAQIAEVRGLLTPVLQPFAQPHPPGPDHLRINRLKLAYGWRLDLADLPQPAIGAATTEVKKGIATDLEVARREIKKNNVWWS